MKNYILFTLMMVFILFMMLFLWIVITSNSLQYPVGYITEQQVVLERGEYQKIKEKLISGKNGFIEILDENNQVIFRKGNVSEEVSSYTNREVSFIPDINETDDFVQIYRFSKENGKESILLIGYSTSEEITSEIYEQWFKVLDHNYNVIYSGGVGEELNTAYTKNEVGYLTGTDVKGNYIAKHKFKNEEGKEYTLISKVKKIEDIEVINALERDMQTILFVFIGVYIICITLFIVWLNRKVKKPLHKLNDAMVSLANGNNTEVIVYGGTFEFAQICDNFNVMVTKLNESEKERIYLESEKQKMIADISHDFKTPITAIQGYAKALSDGLIPLEDQQKYLNIIYQKSSHLTDLINVFYEYSKLEHPNFELALEQTDFSEFLRSYIAEKYEHIVDLGFEIEIEIPETKISTWIDKIQLQRAFDNILGNSLKHNPKGTTLKVVLEECDQKTKVILADNGVGIPSDIIDTIFEAFSVGDDSRHSQQGSGLGLAITKKIIEKHKGEINLIPSLNSDYKTIFEIILPKN
ncbi:MAG: ATP-binding protein [Turicibacter sp.]